MEQQKKLDRAIDDVPLFTFLRVRQAELLYFIIAARVVLWFSFHLGSAMKRVRIANGCGFWGDNLDAPIVLAERGQLDYLTLEYLAELTMSILAMQKQRDPKAGFATDFLDVLGRLVPFLKAQPDLKIITNAGGMNPAGCARTGAGNPRQSGPDGTQDRRRQPATIFLPRLDELLRGRSSVPEPRHWRAAVDDSAIASSAPMPILAPSRLSPL